MNKVVLVGRLTKDPEVRYSKGETSTVVAKYTLAVNRRFKVKGSAEADFIRCVVFGKLAEFAEEYFYKGMRIAISGRIQTGSYVNKEGVKTYTTDILVEEQEFAESRGEAKPVPVEVMQESSQSEDGFIDIPDDIAEELPFR